MGPKQSELKGIERERIEEIEDKAEVYAKSMKKRVAAGVAEKADKAALIAAMKQHKKKSYRLDDGRIVTATEGSTKIAISDAEEEAEPEDEKEDKGKAN